MKYLFCNIAWICIFICFTQKCIENPNWIKYPIGYLITLIPVFLGLGLMVWISSILKSLGWLPLDSF